MLKGMYSFPANCMDSSIIRDYDNKDYGVLTTGVCMWDFCYTISTYVHARQELADVRATGNSSYEYTHWKH